MAERTHRRVRSDRVRRHSRVTTSGVVVDADGNVTSSMSSGPPRFHGSREGMVADLQKNRRKKEGRHG